MAAPCVCGSGLEHVERVDARGIFLTLACDSCWPVKSQEFRPEVLTDPNYDHDEPIDDEDDDIPDYFSEEDDIRRMFADPGGRSSLRAATEDNPRNQPCPNCGELNVLTPKDVSLGYQCDACADAVEMGIDR